MSDEIWYDDTLAVELCWICIKCGRLEKTPRKPGKRIFPDCLDLSLERTDACPWRKHILVLVDPLEQEG